MKLFFQKKKKTFHILITKSNWINKKKHSNLCWSYKHIQLRCHSVTVDLFNRKRNLEIKSQIRFYIPTESRFKT